MKEWLEQAAHDLRDESSRVRGGTDPAWPRRLSLANLVDGMLKEYIGLEQLALARSLTEYGTGALEAWQDALELLVSHVADVVERPLLSVGNQTEETQ